MMPVLVTTSVVAMLVTALFVSIQNRRKPSRNLEAYPINFDNLMTRFLQVETNPRSSNPVFRSSFCHWGALHNSSLTANLTQETLWEEILSEGDLCNQNGKRFQTGAIFLVVVARPGQSLRRTV